MTDTKFWDVFAAHRRTAWDALRDKGPVVEINGVYPLDRAVAGRLLTGPRLSNRA